MPREAPPLSLDDLDESVQGQMTRQQYGSKQEIAGVRLLPLRTHVDDSGAFTELGRLENGALAGCEDFVVRQVNHSLVMPGAVKAWHCHLKQEDVWFVPFNHVVVVGLWDLRRESGTCGATLRFVLGQGRSQLLYIPRGVAHGVANLGTQEALLFYFVNQQFDPANPDEYRLPYDALGKEFWEMRQG